MRAAKFSSCRLMVIALVGWCQLFWDLCMLWGEKGKRQAWTLIPGNEFAIFVLARPCGIIFFFSFLFSSWNRRFVFRNIFSFSSQKIWFSLGRAGPKLVWCKAFAIFRAFANLFSFINAIPKEYMGIYHGLQEGGTLTRMLEARCDGMQALQALKTQSQATVLWRESTFCTLCRDSRSLSRIKSNLPIPRG